MTLVYVAFGANLENPFEMLKSAEKELKQITSFFRLSRLYRSEALDMEPSSPPFLNAVFALETEDSLSVFFEKMEEIERKLGKKPKKKSESRKIDLDLLFFGKEMHKTKKLEIPHPKWKERIFVVEPLFDLTEKVFDNGKWVFLEPILKELRKVSSPCVPYI